MDVQALPPQLRWLLTIAGKGVRSREPGVRELVDKLRAEFPEATSEELARTLIRRRRRHLAMTAAASGAVGAVPGLGLLAVLGVGTVQSVYALEQELELVMAIGLLFDRLPAADDDRTLEALLVIGLAGGAVKLRDDLLIFGGQRLALHAVTTYPKLLLARTGTLAPLLRGALGGQFSSVLARALPLAVGIGVGAGFDWLTVTALGRAALRYYGRRA